MEGPVDEEGTGAASGTLRGRRPLAMPHTKSQMLSQIRKSLSHLHKEEPLLLAAAAQSAAAQGNGSSSRGQHPMYLGGREMTKSTPNLFEDKTVTLSTSDPAAATQGSSRSIYKHKEMQKIRKSLQGFQIADETELRNETNGANGYIDMEDRPVNEHMLRDLVLMGYHEVSSRKCLCHFYTQNLL